MIGSFHQPDAVIFYTEFIKTLPAAEIRSGFSEAVKHALIADADFLDYLMENITDLNAITDEQLTYILKRGIEIKAGVVAQDEREMGLRAVLNFGHTLGHVIETTAGYGKFTDGEAVMTGMVYALYLSEECSGLSFPIKAFEDWIKSLGYTVYIPTDLEFDQALEAMGRDKKSLANKPRFVLLEQVGKPVLKEMDVALLEKTFQSLKSKQLI